MVVTMWNKSEFNEHLFKTEMDYGLYNWIFVICMQ